MKVAIATDSGLYCDNYEIDINTNTIILTIKNVHFGNITITSFKLVDIKDVTCMAETSDYYIESDDTADVVFNCSPLKADEKISGKMQITYSIDDGPVKNTTGVITLRGV